MSSFSGDRWMTSEDEARVARWGGHFAEQWLRRARAYAIYGDYTRSRMAAIALHRVIRAARNFGADQDDPTLPLVYDEWESGRLVREYPATAVWQIVNRYVDRRANASVREQFAEVAREWRRAKPWPSLADVRRYIARNRNRRMTAKQRKAWRRTENFRASICAELAADRNRHPLPHIAQQFDDREARAAGDRVY